MCPSVAVLDAISSGLGLSVGIWDELYLNRTTEPREAIIVCQRLLDRSDPPFPCLQTNLRRLIRISATRYPRVTAEMWYVLAQAASKQSRPKRAALIGRVIARRAKEEGWVDLERDVLAMLGKQYLKSNMPHDALSALEGVTGLPTDASIAWESAAYNLGVALWQLGRYDEADVKWRSVEPLLVNEKIRAHTAMGLGNVALVQQAYRLARSHFERAFDLYTGIPQCEDAVVGALNNCLYSSVMDQDWMSADHWIKVANDWSHIDSPHAWGEFACTCAEMAWKQEEAEHSKELIERAFRLLDERICRSWFTSRLLDAEISLAEGKVDGACERFDQILSRIHDVQDVSLRMSLVLRALNIGLRTNQSSRPPLDVRIRRLQSIHLSHLY